MTELQQLLFHIKLRSRTLFHYNEEMDTLEIDQWLGDIEGFVHDARSEIDRQWREARHTTANLFVKPQSNLEDLI